MTTTLTKASIETLEKRYRTNLINSLSGFKSANLLGTQSSNGVSNLALMSSVFHVGANPALVGLLIRPHSVPRHSLENLLEQGCYTLNAVTEQMHTRAHQTVARYPREQSEFAAVGFDEEYSDQIRAPYVLQSPVKTGLKLVETQTLAVNETVLVIGEIVELRIDPTLISEDGHLDLSAAAVVAISGLDEYHATQSLGRLAYPKA
jgi:flavin reductase (DIM6/NTAB) family NADH-FMN oxidoreductase RutF